MEKKPSPAKKTVAKKAKSASPVSASKKATTKTKATANDATHEVITIAAKEIVLPQDDAIASPSSGLDVKEKKKAVKSSPVSRKKSANDLVAPRTVEKKAANDDKRVVSLPTKKAKLKEQPASKDIRIFQIHYQPQHAEYLDTAFEPYDNAGNKSPLLEFDVFTKIAGSPEVENVRLWGAVSWKFGQKAGTTGAEFIKQIESNPGYDVYFSNSYPHVEALFHNLWLQGETAHPDFLFLCREIFEVAGLPSEILTAMQPSTEFATANYFVASPAFWKKYIAFISRVLVTADKKISQKARAILYSAEADQKGLHANASYIPFVIERLFSVFLKTEGREFKAFKVPLQNYDDGMNVHMKLLKEMKDVAIRTKSLWLAACWVNYRNLYFSNTNGNEWTQKYLRKITPSKIVFDAADTTIDAGAPKK